MGNREWDQNTTGPRTPVEQSKPDSGESRDLIRLRDVWGALGEDDPLWAVLSEPSKRGGRWDEQEFLATGKVEVDAQVEWFAQMGFPRERRHALDFGCGAGRLSRALAGHFQQVTGIDVSPGMIAKARSLNADIGNLEFIENASPSIGMIADASIDLVYSCITLQHIPQDLARGYVAEFLRVLAPGGLAAFQFVIGSDRSLRGRLYSMVPNRWLNPLRRLLWRRSSVFEMHPLLPDRLRDLLARDPQLQLLADLEDGSAGPGWQSRRWIVVRNQPSSKVASTAMRTGMPLAT